MVRMMMFAALAVVCSLALPAAAMASDLIGHAAAAQLFSPDAIGQVAIASAAGALGFGRKQIGSGDEKEIETLIKGLKTATDEVKGFAEKVNGEIKTLGDASAETKKSADDAVLKMNEIGDRITEIEQKMARRGSDEPEQRQTLGQQITESEEFKAALSSLKHKGTFVMPVKAIISALTTDADGSAGDLIVPQRQPGIVGMLQRRMTIRDLLTPGRTSSNSIQYVKETGFTNNAATVTETAGTAKAQSEIKFDIATTNVTTIAHWVLATKQILDDVPQLQSFIDGRLRYGLAYAEEGQLLNGGGTGTDLNGIYTQATAYSQPIVPSAAGNMTKIDVLRLAILQATLAELPATGIVMHPSDWADIELTKTEDGAYLFANPQGSVDPRMWGLPVVPTQAMTIDKFLVGAFQLGAQIFDREDANVSVSTEDSDNFRKNLVTIRAEERIALAVYRTEAFTKGDFSDALAA